MNLIIRKHWYKEIVQLVTEKKVLIQEKQRTRCGTGLAVRAKGRPQAAFSLNIYSDTPVQARFWSQPLLCDWLNSHHMVTNEIPP